MIPAATLKTARAALMKIAAPSYGCEVKTYTAYVDKVIASDGTTIEEVAALMAYYECSLEHLIKRIVRDRMGKG